MSFVSDVVSNLTGSVPEVYDLVVVGSGFAVGVARSSWCDHL